MMAEHGTPARYMKHIRDKEETCPLCKAGWREWQSDRRRKEMRKGVGK